MSDMTPEALSAALADLDRAATFDPGECAECGAPPEDAHSDDCSRAALNGISAARERIEDYLATLDAAREAPPVAPDLEAARARAEEVIAAGNAHGGWTDGFIAGYYSFVDLRAAIRSSTAPGLDVTWGHRHYCATHRRFCEVPTGPHREVSSVDPGEPEPRWFIGNDEGAE